MASHPRALMFNTLTFVLLAGCAGKAGSKGAEPENPYYVERPSEDGLIIVEIDLNSDNRADVFNYYRERTQAARLLVKKEIDLNWDGRVDVTSFYDESGKLTREEMDGDFDGRVDWIDHYQGGVRVMSEVDTEYDGRIDLWKYYESSQVRRRERDTNADGKVDYWEYFDNNGTVIKTGRDVDGDGTMDERSDIGAASNTAGK